jgi:chaperonin GroES
LNQKAKASVSYDLRHFITIRRQTKIKTEENKMRIRPMNDRVIVKRMEQEQQTPGGIIIPDTAKEKPQQGQVVAAGPGKRDDEGRRTPLEVKEKDRILFSKYAGTEIKIDGEEHIFIFCHRFSKDGGGSRRALHPDT